MPQTIREQLTLDSPHFRTSVVSLGHIVYNVPDKFMVLIKNTVSRKVTNITHQAFGLFIFFFLLLRRFFVQSLFIYESCEYKKKYIENYIFFFFQNPNFGLTCPIVKSRFKSPNTQIVALLVRSWFGCADLICWPWFGPELWRLCPRTWVNFIVLLSRVGWGWRPVNYILLAPVPYSAADFGWLQLGIAPVANFCNSNWWQRAVVIGYCSLYVVVSADTMKTFSFILTLFTGNLFPTVIISQ